MVSLLRTNSGNAHFVELVKKLDADLARRDGAEHLFYAQFNGIALLHHVVVLTLDEQAVACGALKEMDANTMEVKRMYTLPAYRGRGLAAQVLESLERWAMELGKERCVLETGKKQPEAIALYRRQGYTPIANYGQYAGVENSVCFEKRLSALHS